jgi:predicted helicase
MSRKLKLKPHQNKAKQDILHSANGLLNNNRAKFISACGTGKTLTALVTSEEYILDIMNYKNSKVAFFILH